MGIIVSTHKPSQVSELTELDWADGVTYASPTFIPNHNSKEKS